MGKKFFIHIPKCGGMTIRKSPILKDKILHCNEKNLSSPQYAKSLRETMKRLGDHHGIEHARFVDLNDATKKNTFFTVVRNPWSRTVSRFLFAKKVIEIEKKVSHKYADISSFEAFLEERHKWKNKEFMWHRAVRGWYPCYDYCTDDGKLTCDVLRFENYDEDVNSYFSLQQNLQPRNVTGYNQDYKTFYDKNTIQIIADWYTKDIDFFGYDFDTGPNKNYFFERTRNDT